MYHCRDLFTKFKIRPMKNLILIAIFFTCFFASCSREEPQTEEVQDNYHLSFKKNGTTVNYTGLVMAHRDTTNGYFTLQINGTHSMATLSSEYMGIYIDNYPGNGNISTGQYLDNATTNTVLTTHLFGGISYQAGQSLAESGVQHNVPIAKHFKVIITHMDANSVKGSFEGDYYQEADVTAGNMIHITEGDFYVKFQ
jgi:hypothetical protein